jgi:mRNA-degrading endonuclease toxin of MazEF toxin-antitoxin module
MPAPVPVPGLVIRYSFLWSHEARTGAEEGSKDRPCAVLLATTAKDGRQMVTVLPVTHTPPSDERLAVEIPAKTKARLGLDDIRSWIVLDEANRFEWPGPDLRPVPGDPDRNVAYGLLPAGLYDVVRTKWLAAFDARRVGQIDRTS